MERSDVFLSESCDSKDNKIARLKAENKKLKERIQSMECDCDFLDALQAAGVDNWSGYEEAQTLLETMDD